MFRRTAKNCRVRSLAFEQDRKKKRDERSTAAGREIGAVDKFKMRSRKTSKREANTSRGCLPAPVLDGEPDRAWCCKKAAD